MSYGLDPPEYLDWYELECLMQMSRVIIRRHIINAGLIPCYVFPGGELRVKRSDVKKFIETCKVVVPKGYTIEDFITQARIKARFENLRRDIEVFDESLKNRSKEGGVG